MRERERDGQMDGQTDFQKRLHVLLCKLNIVFLKQYSTISYFSLSSNPQAAYQALPY